MPLAKLWQAWVAVWKGSQEDIEDFGAEQAGSPLEGPGNPRQRLLTLARVALDSGALIGYKGQKLSRRKLTQLMKSNAPKKKAAPKPKHTISEAKQNEPWDNLTNRWKDLSGIK